MHRKYFIEAMVAGLLIASMPAQAEVSVSAPWVRGVVTGQTDTGAFMVLKSSQTTELVKADSPVAKLVQIHEMKMDGDMMQMRPVKGVALPEGKDVALRPGGYHVMLMGLTKPLIKGELVPITLTFKDKDGKTESVEVKAEVRDLTAQGQPGMMNHMKMTH